MTFLKSKFAKNVMTLITGTSIAQALPFLATPILTRLYNESDFATYTSFFALATIFAVGVGGKYHMAIVIPKSNREAWQIFSLSMYLTFFYVLVLTVIFTLFHDPLTIDMGDAPYFVPLFVLFFGIWSSLTNLSIRYERFKNNAIAKVIQSGGYIITGVVMGLGKLTLYGLILAKILGILASSVYLYFKTPMNFKFMKPVALKKVSKTYIDYPKFGVVPSLLNTVSSMALILILTKFYSTDDLGYYGLTYMVLSAPLGLIGNSFKDVFYQKIAYLISHEKFAQANQFFKKSALSLLAMGIPVCLLLFFFGEPIFSVVFGEKWTKSGLFASILAISFLIKLVVSPLSSIFNASNTLRIASVWQVAYFISTFLTLGYCSYVLELEIVNLLYVYVIHELVLYSLYFLLEYYTIKKVLGHINT